VAGVSAAIELNPIGLVFKPEVGTAVEDQGFRAQPGGNLGALGMRHCQEDHIVTSQSAGIGGNKYQIGKLAQVRVQGPDGLAHIAVCCDGLEFKLGMLRNHAHELAAHVAAGTSNGNCVNHFDSNLAA